MTDLLARTIEEYLADRHTKWRVKSYNLGIIFISDANIPHAYIVMHTDKQKMIGSCKGTQTQNNYTEQTVLQQITNIINSFGIQ